MAFEKINDFTDHLHAMYVKAKMKDEEACREQNREKLRDALAEQRTILEVMTMYYETVLQTGKFKSQRNHMKAIICWIEPSYAQGYFKLKQKPGTGH